MKKRLFIFLAMAISVIALGFSSRLTSSSSVSAQEQGDGRLDALRETHFRDTLVLDVFCDGETFRANGGKTLTDAINGAVKRGDGFIVKGKIYPGGTIRSNSFDPNSVPSIGEWNCRGTFEFDFSEVMTGAEPHVFSTQFHLLNDGRGLVTDGPEGGAPQVRSLIGGMGAFTGAVAEVVEEPLGQNSTGLFNLRFTFKFKKGVGR